MHQRINSETEDMACCMTPRVMIAFCTVDGLLDLITDFEGWLAGGVEASEMQDCAAGCRVSDGGDLEC